MLEATTNGGRHWMERNSAIIGVMIQRRNRKAGSFARLHELNVPGDGILADSRLQPDLVKLIAGLEKCKRI
jgi:hypothetical protein